MRGRGTPRGMVWGTGGARLRAGEEVPRAGSPWREARLGRGSWRSGGGGARRDHKFEKKLHHTCLHGVANEHAVKCCIDVFQLAFGEN